jgi:hypothetical protein
MRQREGRDDANRRLPIFFTNARVAGRCCVLNRVIAACSVLTDLFRAALLGQSFLSRVGSWTLDNKRHILILAR